MVSLLALLVSSALVLCYFYIWVIVLFHELGHLIACLLFRRKAVQLRVAFPPGVSLSLGGNKLCIGPNVFAGGGVMAEECGSGPEALADLVLAWTLPAVAVGALTWGFTSLTVGAGDLRWWAGTVSFAVVLVAGLAYEFRSRRRNKVTT